MLDNPLLQKPAYFVVWVRLLFEAAYEPRQVMFKGERVTLQPGQLTCGAKQLSSWTGIQRGTVERVLKRFESEEQVRRETSSEYSLITILNWGKYQINEEQVRNQRGTSEERVDTPKEVKKLRILSKDSTEENPQEPKSYGKKELNELLVELKRATGREDFEESATTQRYALQHIDQLRTKIGQEEYERRLDVILSDDFIYKKRASSLNTIFSLLKAVPVKNVQLAKRYPKEQFGEVWADPLGKKIPVFKELVPRLQQDKAIYYDTERSMNVLRTVPDYVNDYIPNS